MEITIPQIFNLPAGYTRLVTGLETEVIEKIVLAWRQLVEFR